MGALPPWFNKDRKTNNSKSRKYERDLAKETGGRTTAGSGSSWRAPQDVKSDTHLIQHKFTGRGSFSITLREWEGIRADALRAGLEPALVIDFDGSGRRLIITEG